MVERIDPVSLGPFVPSSDLSIDFSKETTFYIKRWMPTSAKYDMMMSYLPDIDVWPSSSNTVKMGVPTRKN
jgi:hypothetical protein